MKLAIRFNLIIARTRRNNRSDEDLETRETRESVDGGQAATVSLVLREDLREYSAAAGPRIGSTNLALRP